MNNTTHKAKRHGEGFTASQFLKKLPSDINYAIERGLSEIDQALISDLDIVITKQGFMAFYEMAQQRDMVVSVTLSYGGARLFIAFVDGIKRIDFMWHCSYLGIPICSTQHLLAARQLDPDSGLYILTEGMQAEVVFAVKNAHHSAEKYRVLLETHGLKVLSLAARRRWLFLLAAGHPFATLTGFCRVFFSYGARIAYPSGINVSGISGNELKNNNILCYLFQNRIRETGLIMGFFRSRIGSELCIVGSKGQADIIFSGSENLESAEQSIQMYLRTHRSNIPLLLVAIC